MPVQTGAQVRIKDGKLSVIDGPFVEAKEVVGGYAIFELRDKDEAVAMASESGKATSATAIPAIASADLISLTSCRLSGTG